VHEAFLLPLRGFPFIGQRNHCGVPGHALFLVSEHRTKAISSQGFALASSALNILEASTHCECLVPAKALFGEFICAGARKSKWQFVVGEPVCRNH